jgi:hypothetical protein
VDPRAGLDTEARGKILCPCRGSNPDRPVSGRLYLFNLQLTIIIWHWDFVSASEEEALL